MRSTFKVLFYLKRNKKKTQSAVPLMGRITVNGTISQFSAKLTVPERLWEVRGGRAKGRSLEADRINRHLDDIRSQLDRHYRDIRDRESYVTAEKVKNAWLGFGKRYRTLLSTFRSFTDDLHGRIGVDRSKNTWYRYLATMKHLQAFLTAKYRVSDIALAELEQSFIEQFHVYLKTERALKLTSICRYLDCLINVVKVSFNDGIMPRNPFASYRYNEPTPERAFLNEEEILTLQHAALRTKKQRIIRDRTQYGHLVHLFQIQFRYILTAKKLIRLIQIIVLICGFNSRIKMNQIIFILSSFFGKLIFHPGCHCILIFTLVIHSPPDAAPVVCSSWNFCYAPVTASLRIIRLDYIALEPTGSRITKYISLTKRRIPCRSPDIQTSIYLCFF